jgi:hypothetical protein
MNNSIIFLLKKDNFQLPIWLSERIFNSTSNFRKTENFKSAIDIREITCGFRAIASMYSSVEGGQTFLNDEKRLLHNIHDDLDLLYVKAIYVKSNFI